MADLTTQIEGALETAWLALVNRVAFGYTVNRRGWRDGSAAMTLPSVVVQAQRAVPELGMRGPLYAVPVSIIAYTHANDDESQAVLNSLHGTLEKLAANTTEAELTAVATNFVVHGIQYVDGTIDFDGTKQGLSVDLVCHIQAVLADVSTTTTTTTSTTTTTTTTT